jgi:hypothetical protein
MPRKKLDLIDKTSTAVRKPNASNRWRKRYQELRQRGWVLVSHPNPNPTHCQILVPPNSAEARRAEIVARWEQDYDDIGVGRVKAAITVQ